MPFSRYRFLWWFSCHYLLLMLVSRLGLLWLAGNSAGLDLLDVLTSFSLGSLFDLGSLVYLLLPIAIWLTLIPLAWRQHRIWRGAGIAFSWSCLFLLLTLVASEWVFWGEFSSRFNFIAVDYLVYTHEVLGNIRQSYPLGLWFGLCALLATLLQLASAALMRRLPTWRALRRRELLPGLALLMVLVSIGLNAEDRNQRTNQYANELAGNGLFCLFGAFRHNELDYQRFYPTLPLAEAGRLVRASLQTPDSQFVSAQPQDLRRQIRHAGAEKRMNVVLITVESLSANYLGVFGNPHHLTPNLDRLAAQGMLFTRLYATGNRTVRGLEALSLAVPPTPGQSIVRRPNNEGLFTLGSVFRSKGYDSLFLYGGYGTFDNMNAYFAGNGYEVEDRTSLQRDQISAETIWGVADEDLFGMALRQFDQQAQLAKPFFAHLMTTSNHRPYHFPDGRIDLPQGSRNAAIKYTDWAIGEFLRQAQQHSWAANTLFVIVADHCASSAGKTEIPVEGYHIPMIIWSPGHIPPQQVDRLASQIDVAPTLLGLLNFNYRSQFFGQDVFATPKGPQRAFIATYQGLGYLTEQQLTILNPRQKPQTRWLDPTASQEDASAYQRQAIAWYESASHAFRSGAMQEAALDAETLARR
ncbi:LTA synthase family protein [Pseudaeromonas sharmana]|uniref:LTA synthase family protein n=1 Tax=Pseudaeromonas sharmana TaxID=328412 RepID=A0ABV8CRE0_9GAMM